jgi:hypothetical protein
MIYSEREKHTIFFCYWTIPFAIAVEEHASIDFGVGSRKFSSKTKSSKSKKPIIRLKWSLQTVNRSWICHAEIKGQ